MSITEGKGVSRGQSVAELETNWGVLFLSYIVEIHLEPQAAHEKWDRNPNETGIVEETEAVDRILCKINNSHPFDSTPGSGGSESALTWTCAPGGLLGPLSPHGQVKLSLSGFGLLLGVLTSLHHRPCPSVTTQPG